MKNGCEPEPTTLPAWEKTIENAKKAVKASYRKEVANEGDAELSNGTVKRSGRKKIIQTAEHPSGQIHE